MTPLGIEVRARSAVFQQIASLRHNRRQRSQQRRFLVEGVRSINAMRAADWPVDAYLYAREGGLSDWARRVLADSTAARHIALDGELMAELCDRSEPSELLAVAVMDEPLALDALPVREPALCVVADRPASPGNLGTLIRSCDAFGVDALAVFGHAADRHDPRAIRAAVGSWFAVPVAPVASPRALADWLAGLRAAQSGLQVVGSSASGSTPIGEQSFLAPTVLLLGNERAGLSHGLVELCDRVVAIPIGGRASSLNLASAASILLYEISRQRTAGSAPAG